LKILEDWLHNPEPEDGFQETVMPDGAECQHEDQLEEVGVELVVELKEAYLLEEIA
jgi:hypothetical protein